SWFGTTEITETDREKATRLSLSFSVCSVISVVQSTKRTQSNPRKMFMNLHECSTMFTNVHPRNQRRLRNEANAGFPCSNASHRCAAGPAHRFWGPIPIYHPSDTLTDRTMGEVRVQHLAAVKTAVVKLGTQLLTNATGRLDVAFIAAIAKQVAELRQRGVSVTIVSSGAIGAGLAELGLSSRPSDLGRLQAVAAVGQRRLMDTWAAAFEPFKLPVAQLLLTREDIDHRTRFLNVRNTIHAVQELGAIPIINENDTISTDEIVKITFGDNDILAALVASALRADLLVLLTVVDGLLDASHQPVRLVESIGQAR